MEQREADPSSRSTTSAQDTTKPRSEATLRRTVTLPETPGSSMTYNSIRDPSNMPFNSLLAELAHSMTLLSWQQVSDVLKKFIYTDTTEPHGSRWFWKTMGSYLDRRRRFQEQRQQQAAQMPERRKSKEPESPKPSDGSKQGGSRTSRRWSTTGGPSRPKQRQKTSSKR